MMYPEELIIATEQDLTTAGFVPLKTAEDVKVQMNQYQHGTILLFVNATCGCVGTSARHGVKMALTQSDHQPDQLLTVFAGVDEEATTEVFTYTKPYPLSSPALALFKAGNLVYFMERHQLKHTPYDVLAEDLQRVLATHCRLSAVA